MNFPSHPQTFKVAHYPAAECEMVSSYIYRWHVQWVYYIENQLQQLETAWPDLTGRVGEWGNPLGILPNH